MVQRQSLGAEEVLLLNFATDLAKACAREMIRADPGTRRRLLDVVQTTIPSLIRQVEGNPPVRQQLEELSGEIEQIARSRGPARKFIGAGRGGAKQQSGIVPPKPDGLAKG